MPDNAIHARLDQLIERIDHMKRQQRVLLSLAIAVEFVILASVVIDRLLIDAVLSGDVGAGLPAWIAAGLGVVFYGLGWWALVGFDLDATRPWRAGRPAGLYVAAGVIGLGVLLILVVIGLLFGYVL